MQAHTHFSSRMWHIDQVALASLHGTRVLSMHAGFDGEEDLLMLPRNAGAESI